MASNTVHRRTSFVDGLEVASVDEMIATVVQNKPRLPRDIHIRIDFDLTSVGKKLRALKEHIELVGGILLVLCNQETPTLAGLAEIVRMSAMLSSAHKTTIQKIGITTHRLRSSTRQQSTPIVMKHICAGMPCCGRIGVSRRWLDVVRVRRPPARLGQST